MQAFITRNKKLLIGIAIGYLLSRQFGARIESQLRMVASGLTSGTKTV